MKNNFSEIGPKFEFFIYKYVFTRNLASIYRRIRLLGKQIYNTSDITEIKHGDKGGKSESRKPRRRLAGLM